MVASLTLKQSYDYHSVSELILTDMGKIATKYKKAPVFSILFGMQYEVDEMKTGTTHVASGILIGSNKNTIQSNIPT